MVSIALTCLAAEGASLTGNFTAIPQGSVVNLTSEGPLDWVHWGLYTETSIDRKAGVTSLISDFRLLDATNGFAYVYQYTDNYNGYSWSDGTPNAAITNTTTGVWAYGVPAAVGSGFELTVPADTTVRTLKVYVGAYAARGKLEARLSDSSAPAYTDSSLANLSTNGPSGVYLISYAAQSAGQSLSVKWTLEFANRRDIGNITLQAAALAVPGANHPPAVRLTSPSDNTSFSAGTDIAVTADATDADGNVTVVEYFAGENKIGQTMGGPFSFTWTNVPAGDHVLTARATDDGGASTVSQPVEIFVHGAGGSLSGAAALPPDNVDLTAEGTSDWAHWGLFSTNSFDHKAGVSPQLGNFAQIGTATVQTYSDNLTAYSWSDGIPTESTNGTKTGVFIHGLTNGFLLTVPADTNARTLKVYVGLYGAQGDFRAYLSDFSGPAYTDSSLGSVLGNAYAVHTLNYTAASAGQRLVVKYTAKTLFDADFGNVTLQAATLSGSVPLPNSPPTVMLTSPANDATFPADGDITIQAGASDSDGSVVQVQFFAGPNLLGTATDSPYLLVWTNVPAGAYSLTARATDNQGATTTSSPISIAVASPTVSAATLVDPVVSGKQLSFSFPTQSGVNYTAQFTDSLNPINWQTLTNVAGSGGAASITDSNVTQPQRYYRVRAQ